MSGVYEVARMTLLSARKEAELAAQNIAMANQPLKPNAKDEIEGYTFSSSMFLDSLNKHDPAHSQKIKYVYRPDSEFANESGFVAYPDIDIASEFVKLTLAKRIYEASVRVFNSHAEMNAKTLEIGKV